MNIRAIISKAVRSPAPPVFMVIPGCMATPEDLVHPNVIIQATPEESLEMMDPLSMQGIWSNF